MTTYILGIVGIILMSRSLLAGTLFAKQWRKSQPRTEIPTRVFHLSLQSTAFEEYYDTIQGHLQVLSGMDEFLAG